MTTLPEPSVSQAGTVYGQHVTELLAAEYERRKTLEARGGAIVATTSTLFTIIFTLTVLVAPKDYRFDSKVAIGALVSALCAFVASAIVAIIVQNVSFKYTVTSDATLDGMVSDAHWRDDEDDARRMCLARHINTIKSLRRGNSRKLLLATIALALQGVAVLLLAISLATEFLAHYP